MANLMPGENGPTWAPGNIDLATQQQDLARKRALLQAMQLMSLQQQPTEMAGHVAIRQSPINLLGRVLQSWGGTQGMNDLGQQERELVQRQQQKSADAVTELMQASQPTPGTPTTMTEVQGPMPDGGQAAPRVEPGAAPGFDTARFGKALAGAQMAGSDPQLLAAMLKQYQLNQRLSADPETASMVPGFNAQQQQPSMSTLPGGEQQLQIPYGAPAGAGPGAAGGGMIGGVPRKAIAFALSGDPGFEKAGAMIAEAAKPISGRAGAPLWGRDANGNAVMIGFSPSLEKGQTVSPQGAVSTAPGYIPSAKEIETSAGQAKAPFQRPVSVPVSTGGTMEVPFDQFLKMYGAGQGQPGAAPSVYGGAMAPGVSPSGALAQSGPLPLDQMRVAAQSAAADGKPSFMANGRVVNVADVLGGQQQPQSAGQFGPQSTAAKAEAEVLGAGYAKQAEAIDAAAQGATQGRATVAQMKDALGQITTNASAPARQRFAELLQGWYPGLTEDSPVIKGILGGSLSAQQEFGKLSYGNAATQLRTLLPGQRLTQMEIANNFINSPNPALQKAASLTMLEMQDGMYRWAQDKQQAKDDWVDQYKTLARFEGNWNSRHPLTGNDRQGQPYIPTLAEVKARMAAAQQEQPMRAGEIPQPQSGPPPQPQAQAQRIVNPQTGEVRELRDGQWVPTK